MHFVKLTTPFMTSDLEQLSKAMKFDVPVLNNWKQLAK